MQIVKKIYLPLAIVGTIAALSIGCSRAQMTDDTEPPAPKTPRPAPDKPVKLEPVAPGLVAAYNNFGFALFEKLRQRDDKANLLVSPLSIATALTMTYNGAAGATQKSMADTLKLGNLSLPDINQVNLNLKKNLEQGDPKIQLSIANSLWARRDLTFDANFQNNSKVYFDAQVSTLDFADPNAADIINGWVSKNTRGKIPKIVDRISGNAALYLINAIYFKGSWQRPFDAGQTRDGDFTLAGGTKKKVPFMTQSGKYRYLNGGDFTAVSLPYGNGNTTMCFLLPNEGKSLDSLLQQLNGKTWDGWMPRFVQRQGDIEIPRFKLESDLSLNGSLKSLGMAVAFDANRADFTGMRAEKDLFISEVKHKAVMEVNEEGTEAAAATSVEMGVTSAMPSQERFSFVANRPFLAVLRDRSGSILFMTVVREPK